MTAVRTRPRVLVVDDDPLIVSLLSAVLEDARFAIDIAKSGAEALKIAADRRPDVVVLDVMMPGMDGIEVCRSIRADPAMTDVRIVMLTARTDPFDRDQAIRAGADAYFTKPFSPLELIQAVNAALNGVA